MWFLIRKSRRRKVINPSYKKYKEHTRNLILAKLEYWAPICGVNYKRVAIRDTKRCWGSCSSLGNLNFSYKLLFLPNCLADYIIVHELCHLKEMNHSPKFWLEVEKIMPDYKNLVVELRKLEKTTRTSVEAMRKDKDTHTCAYCTGREEIKTLP